MPTRIGRALTAAVGSCFSSPRGRMRRHSGAPGAGQQVPAARRAFDLGRPRRRDPEPHLTPTPDPVVLQRQRQGRGPQGHRGHPGQGEGQAGELTKVKLAYTYTDRQGQREKGTVRGALSKDRATWTAGDRLEPAGDVQADDGRPERGQAVDHQDRLLHDPQPQPRPADLPDPVPAEGQQGRDRHAGGAELRRAGQGQGRVREEPADHHLADSGRAPGDGSPTPRSGTGPKNYWKPGTKVR